jgi:dTDP-4-dehydrorhamnose 3,5-epimerase
MHFRHTVLRDVVVIDPEPAADSRGLFARMFCEEEFGRAGLPVRFVQSSTSFNRLRGTLRGMHYQEAPKAEGKLIRCTHGKVYDVALDLRPASEGFGQWVAVELSADNRRALYIPPGFAHGFQTLVDETEILYSMTEFFAPEAARGVRWNDSRFAISWPVPGPILSERDASYPDFDS